MLSLGTCCELPGGLASPGVLTSSPLIAAKRSLQPTEHLTVSGQALENAAKNVNLFQGLTVDG